MYALDVLSLLLIFYGCDRTSFTVFDVPGSFLVLTAQIFTANINVNATSLR